ncbi:hypothetical protein S2L_11 [Cyanophage S-2L]|nr:hypothetical protein S2L_11 [Cyanophage S-2L]
MAKLRTLQAARMAISQCRKHRGANGPAQVHFDRQHGRRQGSSRAPIYHVRVADGMPYGTPLDQPQWGEERVVFVGNRAEILAWAEAYCAS